jgi:hypothetical protein
VVVLLVVALAGCAEAGSDGTPGEGDEMMIDAGETLPDVNVPRIDAAPGAIDAAPGAIDADLPDPIDASPPGGGCESAQVCEMATMLDSVGGDTGSDKITRTGHQSAWFTLRFTEDDHGLFANDMKMSVKLTSPAGADYTVFVYMDEFADQPECTDGFGSKTMNGKVHTVSGGWGESGIGANNLEDGRDVAIEVKPLSSTCTANQTWTLEISGNP